MRVLARTVAQRARQRRPPALGDNAAMRRFSLIFALLGLFAACSPALNWRSISLADAPLSLELPCKPDYAVRDVDWGVLGSSCPWPAARPMGRPGRSRMSCLHNRKRRQPCSPAGSRPCKINCNYARYTCWCRIFAERCIGAAAGRAGAVAGPRCTRRAGGGRCALVGAAGRHRRTCIPGYRVIAAATRGCSGA